MISGLAVVKLVLTVAISKPFPDSLLGSVLWRPAHLNITLAHPRSS